MNRVAAAFESCQAAGLFALAATRPDAPPPAFCAFWLDFSCRYLTQLCRMPESTVDHLEPIDPPVQAELETVLLGAPPMQGGEYLSADVLHGLWIDLDEWVRREIAASGIGLS